MKQLSPQKTPAKTCEAQSNNGKSKKQTITIEEDSKILLSHKACFLYVVFPRELGFFLFPGWPGFGFLAFFFRGFLDFGFHHESLTYLLVT